MTRLPLSKISKVNIIDWENDHITLIRNTCNKYYGDRENDQTTLIKNKYSKYYSVKMTILPLLKISVINIMETVKITKPPLSEKNKLILTDYENDHITLIGEKCNKYYGDCEK